MTPMDANFRDYAEHCPDAVLVTDRDGRIQYVNAAFERMTGYRRDELVGNRPAALKSGTHEADFYRALWDTLLAGVRYVWAERLILGAISLDLFAMLLGGAVAA